MVPLSLRSQNLLSVLHFSSLLLVLLFPLVLAFSSKVQSNHSKRPPPHSQLHVRILVKDQKLRPLIHLIYPTGRQERPKKQKPRPIYQKSVSGIYNQSIIKHKKRRKDI
eukprot:Lithocolla_globosa_v1_NODE_8209_length_850_cov_2.528302.p2 type:complete len:109 gc:universal NODE_8209_length_850_cov_2.528302:813-487(-)